MATYIDPVTGKPGHRRPPVIPEIAKAYENDPRTKLAVQAMANGSDTSPVAQGKYAYADGIARALTGAVGGYENKKQSDAYQADEDKVLALRAARGQDGLTGLNAAAPQNAGQVATALGAPPPQAPPQAPPAAPPGPPQGGLPPPQGIPMAPIPPQAPPGGPPVQGAGPVARRPFGPSVGANAPPFLQAPAPEAVPDAPAPVARPTAPDAVGPTRSKLLEAAYRVMADGNAYESSRGQDMYTEGLSEQTKLDESATERRQKLADMGYQTDLGTYANAQSQDRETAIHDREATVEHNRKQIDDYGARTFQYGVHKEDQVFEAHQKALDRANAMAVAMARARAHSGAGGGTALTEEEQNAVNVAVGAHKLDPMRLTGRQLKTLAGALVANPGLDAIRLHGMAQLAANPGAERQAMTLQILPDVLNNVRNAGKKLNFSDVQFVGKLQAFTKGQLNDPAFTNYMTQRNDALLTTAQVMRASGATDLSTKMESEAAHPTMSPRAMDGWFQGQLTASLPRVQMAERKGLLDPGTTDAIRKAYATPEASPAPYSDPGKEARYQAWLKSHGN